MTYVNLTYALTMAVALTVCSLLLRLTQRRLQLSGIEKLGIGTGAFCGAMIGAKLPFLLSDWEGLISGTGWLSHGKTIMCGIVGGYLGVESAKWALDIRLKTGDSFALPVAVAVAIGRLGCFQAGCCYGTPTSLPWGVVFPTAVDNPFVTRHPTQIYESIFHGLAAVALLWLTRQGLFRGQLIKLYLLCYLSYRFVTEFIRPESQLLFGLTGYQWAALALFPVFIGLWIRDRANTSCQSVETKTKVPGTQ
ncbi:MAG: prolipoprotein diacylglyceryl transferase [Planctomycetales bacterium]|nr:prolipoprotein diacylglyceryl transferase [Planctomycetales bacterium]